jgi:CubicO group peptidase (beta-lactamase class C family)
VNSVALSPAADTLMAFGDTVRLTAEATDANGHAVPGSEFSWSSSDASVAAVDASGLVTAAANGTVTITASAGGASGTAAVTVATPNVDAVFDSLMLAFTRERDIGAAALGIMRDGEIVYDRAFGWMDSARVRPVRQDVVMRVMSVSKVVTAVAIRRLVADGRMSLDDYVFDLGQDAGGLLDLDPVPSIGDPRIAEITVRHLLWHEGGWGTPATGVWWGHFRIAKATGESVPVSREAMIRYLMGLPLGFAPGTNRAYSNEGFLVLGHIVETVSGRDYMDYVHETLFAPLGIGREDFILGRSLPADRSDREPWYDSRGASLTINLFDPRGPRVPWPDGGWDQRVTMAYGGLAASTEALLRFIEVYQASHDEFLGMARHDGWGRYRGRHIGSNALVRQTPSGVNYAAIFNKSPRDPETQSGTRHFDYALELQELVDELLSSGRIVWP